jgi:predicted transcriptional regulator YheO
MNSRAQVKPATRKPSRSAAGAKGLSAAVVAQRKTTMAVLHSVAEMLGRAVGPNVEAVVHDLTRPTRSVVAIANGHVTGRAIGSSILEGPKEDKAFAHAIEQLAPGAPSTSTIVSGYPTLTPTGQPLKSDTVIFRDQTGVAFAALCINSDMAVFEAAHSWLERVLRGEKRDAATAPAKRPQMDALMQQIFEEAVRAFGKPVGTLNRAEKVAAVERMLRSGVFMVRGSIEKAAAMLGVTRFTIYNYLEEVRKREADRLA